MLQPRLRADDSLCMTASATLLLPAPHQRLRLCHDCGSTWKPLRGGYSASSLRMRRAARRAGVRTAWVYPRPSDRCAHCMSVELGTVYRLAA